jgi:hypothetical protein
VVYDRRAQDCLGVETMKEAPVSRLTRKAVAAIPRYIDFRRQPCSTSGSIPTTIKARRRGIEWERPHTLSWRSTKVDEAE